MKPKLIAALILGMSSLALASIAYADSSHGQGQGQSQGEGDGHGNDDHGGDDGSQTSTGCTGSVINACGMQIVKSVCSTTSSEDNDGHHDSEHQDAEDNDRESDHDSHGHHYTDDDRDSPSNHPGQDFSFQYYYDSNGSMQQITAGNPAPAGAQVVNVSNSQRLGTSPDGKITICHRMGGAEVTLNIPDDQINGVKAHGHGNHPLDTIGRCEDEDDTDPSQDTVPRQKLSQQSNVTTSVQACLAAPAGTQVTVTLSSGSTWTGAAPGCNAAGVFCSVPVGGSISGGSLPNSGAPNRGGVRTLR